MAQLPVWAIDVGEASIKAVKMRLRGGVPEVLEVDMVDLEQSLLDEESDEEDRNIVVRQALMDLAKRRNLGGTTIISSIPGRLTISKLVELPPTEKTKIPEMVKFEMQNVIPFPIEDIIWDYVVMPAAGPGSPMEVNLLATKKESVYAFLSNFQQAKINVDILQTAPLALYNLVKVDQFPDENVVVVDIGAQNTDLVIINDDRFWVRNVPKAGHRLTQAIEQQFSVSFHEAERLKVEASTPAQMKQVNEAVRPVLRDLVGELSRTIGFYKSQAKDANFDRILFLGNTIRVAGFKKFMTSTLPYKVDYFSVLRRIRVSKRIRLEAFKTNLPSFGIALGLGLQALGVAPNQVNLKPREHEQIKKQLMRRSLVAAAILLIVLASGLVRMGRTNQAKADNALIAQYDELKEIKLKRMEEVKLLEMEVKREARIEPFLDRKLAEQALLEINRAVDQFNRPEDNPAPRRAQMFVHTVDFQTVVDWERRARSKDAAKNGNKKIKCKIQIMIPGEQKATKAILENDIVSALKDSDLTQKSEDGDPIVTWDAEPQNPEEPFMSPLTDDPDQGNANLEPGTFQSKTGYFLWTVQWEIASTVKTHDQILAQDEAE